MLSRKFDSATLISLSGIVNSISDKSLSCIDENSANSFREAARSIFSFAAGEDLLKALASSIEKLSKSEISAANSFERFYGELAKEAETNLRKTNLFSGELKFLEEAVSETKRLLALQSQKNVLSDKIWAQIAKLLASFGELWANSKVSSQTRNLERIGKDFLKIAALSLFWDFVGDERNRKRKAPEKTSGKDDNLGKEDNYFSEAKLRNEKKQRISQISKLFQNILDSENCRSLSSTVLKCFGDLCSISDVFLNRDEELNTKICDFFIRFADERVIDGEEADFEKEDIFAACKLVLIDALKFKPILFKLIQIYRISEKELKFILRASISKAISANRRAIGEIVQKYVDERKPVYLQFMEAKERAVLQKLVKNGETDSKVIVEAVFEE
ncbi:hypothetical protein MHBO_001621 [Bonamia ostreae]|uniref:Uncharacterized protein n=1 Tax=Bonamia ostreae TaxID=126728 RepID=A0ABV2AKE8_9EUKA